MSSIPKKAYSTGSEKRELILCSQPRPASSRASKAGAFISWSLYTAQLPFNLFRLNVVRLQSPKRLQLVPDGLARATRRTFLRKKQADIWMWPHTRATLLCHQGLGQQLRSWGCSCWGSLGVCTPSPNSQPYSVGPTTSLLPLCSFPYSSNWMQLGPAKRTGIRLSTAGFFLCSRVAKNSPNTRVGGFC